MKIQWKKIGSLTAASMVSLSLLAGCAGSNNNKPEPTDEPKAPVESDGGSAKHKVTWLGLIGGYPLGEEAYAANYLEEKFNVELEPVRVDDEQQLNLYLSTGDIPDVFSIKGDNINNYAKNGIISEIPLDLIKEHMPNYYKMVMQFDESALSYGMVDGKIYALPVFDSTVSPVPIAIRGDWLKNVGAEIPTTIQELEDVFVKFRNDDPDRNGKKDTYGLSMGSDNTNFWFQSIFGAFGTHPFLWQKNGDHEIAYGFTLPQTKEALKLLRKWYTMELIDPEFITDKTRTNGQDDTAYKFATGRIGYNDNLTYDDHQWDNDGNLSAKWVANSPEWQEFYSNPDNAYVTSAFTEIPSSGPQPVYVNVKPPVGPEGKSGSFNYNTLRSFYIVLGKEAASSEDKLIRIMQMLEADVSDEETYVNLQIGPEDTVWEWNDQNQRVYKKDWLESELYHPQGRTLGTGSFFDIFFNMNPDFKTVFGGPRAEQRYTRTQNLISTELPPLENALKAPIESASKYTGELNAMIQEYILKAILGEVNIDATFDDTVQKWFNNGGNEMMEEANAWYSSTQ